jgi:hypothetical protein
MKTPFVIAILALVGVATPNFSDETYLAKPAAQKVEQIWTAVE